MKLRNKILNLFFRKQTITQPTLEAGQAVLIDMVPERTCYPEEELDQYTACVNFAELPRELIIEEKKLNVSHQR